MSVFRYCALLLALLCASPLNAQPQPYAPAYFSGALPADAIAYSRLPNLWGILAAPKGNVMDRALNAAPFKELFAGLHQALVDKLRQLPPDVRPLFELTLAKLRSPLELLLLPPKDDGLPALLLTAELDVAGSDEVSALLASLAQAIGPYAGVGEPLDDAGYGSLMLPTGPVAAYFDADRRRLFLLVEQSPKPEPDYPALRRQLDALEAARAAPQPSPLAALEREIDASGQGLFVWINPTSLLPFASAMLPPEQQMLLMMTGAGQTTGVGFGVGVADGKGRLKLVVEMPNVGLRSLLPAVDAGLEFEIGAAASILFMLALPGPEDWQRIEQQLALMRPDVAEDIAELRRQTLANTGAELDFWLGLFGPELAGVYGDSNGYLVLKLRDPSGAGWDQALQLLAERAGVVNENRELDGRRYGHLIVPPLDPAALADTDVRLDDGFPEIPQHLYWKLRDGYLYIAGVPQTLLHHDRLNDKLPAARWLDNSQRVRGDNALLLVSGRGAGVPALMYDYTLVLLLLVGDLLERPVDLFALPAAGQIGIPASGGYSFKLESSQQRLGVELVYESNPSELLLAGGAFTAVALLGVGAAVAIPAYQDYQVRAGVGASLYWVEQAKTEVESVYLSTGSMPNADQLALLGLNDADDQVRVEPDSGVIVLRVLRSGYYLDDPIRFIPDASTPGALNWVCDPVGEATKYAPPECRW